MTSDAFSPANPADLPLVQVDPWLAPFAPVLRRRTETYQNALAHINAEGGLLGQITQGHRYFGFTRGAQNGQAGVWYREWLPGARAVFLTGDFNWWDRQSHPLTRDPFGTWQLFLPSTDYAHTLTHQSRVKVHIVDARGVALDRIPAYARRVLQEDDLSFVAQFWMPPDLFAWENAAPVLGPRDGLRVYEAHVGMAQEAERVGTFDEFTDTILGRIAALGYNAVQLMGVMEHPYYGSFGYHVSNFFAVSSRFGTPEQLKRLIDQAHGRGLIVLLDLVHSHAVKNLLEGLSHLDGTDGQYFHAGARGQHAAWDSLLFDYAKPDVRQFLLSNVRFWLDEFRFDGFRFDGVTSMLYHDHGLNREFTTYDEYFDANTDDDALLYLQLANDVAHAVRPSALTVAEDVSGFPGLARPTHEGGTGFDFRLAMGLPDFWMRQIKVRDENWDLGGLWHNLLNRRAHEKHVGYAESHDQSIVGDQSLAFRLMGSAMYTDMNKSAHNPLVERGVALHKMIRLLTFSLCCTGYLNFIGNEWGHPEWVDFPRDGNDWSFAHARRQWSLADSPFLRYAGLNAFDRALQYLDKDFYLLTDPLIELLAVHEQDKWLVYRRGPLVFAVNFHPTNSYADFRIPVPDATDYRVILDTDAGEFGGWSRNTPPGGVYPRQTEGAYGRAQSLLIYLPSRSAQVLAPAT